MRQTLAALPSLRLKLRPGRLALWRRNLTTRRALAELPRHLLDDVGLTEAEARCETRKAFWQ